jgi:hypothetical protein
VTGGAGSDIFLYGSLNDGIDTLTDFVRGSDGDVLHLQSVLVNYVQGSSILSNFVELAETGGNTMISINADGRGGDSVQLVNLQGITGLALNDMLAQGNLVID